MRISDWSSYVCSSDLLASDRDRRQRVLDIVLAWQIEMKGFPARFGFAVVEADREMRAAAFGANVAGMQIGIVRKTVGDDRPADVGEQFAHDRIAIGKASCRERVCQYG